MASSSIISSIRTIVVCTDLLCLVNTIHKVVIHIDKFGDVKFDRQIVAQH